MRYWILMGLMAFTPLWGSGATGVRTLRMGPIQLELSASPMANLVYHLDCLSGIAPDASREAIRNLWIRQGWLGDADNQLITQWKTLGERYRLQASFKATCDQELGYPAGFDGVKVADQVRKAGLLANDLESFRRLAGVVMKPGDGEAACRILAAFQPRFFRWWSGKGPQWQAMVDRTAARLLRLEKAGLFDKLSYYFEVSAPTPPKLRHFLMPVSSNAAGIMHGKTLDTCAILEVQDQDDSDRSAAMLVHELCHQLADRWMQDCDLRKQMLAGGDPWAVPAYEFLDEALATAIGNGLVPSLLSPKPDTDWYLNTSIDRYAKSLLPVLQDSFKNHRRIHDSKVIEGFTEAFRRTFADQGDSSLLMRRMAMAFDPKVWPAVQDLMEQVQCVDSWQYPLRSANGIRFFQQNPRLSGLLVVTAEDLNQLEPWKSLLGEAMAARIQQDLAAYRGVVYTVATSGHGFIFVVAGRDLAGLRAVLPFLKKGMPSGTGRFAAA